MKTLKINVIGHMHGDPDVLDYNIDKILESQKITKKMHVFWEYFDNKILNKIRSDILFYEEGTHVLKLLEANGGSLRIEQIFQLKTTLKSDKVTNMLPYFLKMTGSKEERKEQAAAKDEFKSLVSHHHNKYAYIKSVLRLCSQFDLKCLETDKVIKYRQELYKKIGPNITWQQKQAIIDANEENQNIDMRDVLLGYIQSQKWDQDSIIYAFVGTNHVHALTDMMFHALDSERIPRDLCIEITPFVFLSEPSRISESEKEALQEFGIHIKRFLCQDEGTVKELKSLDSVLKRKGFELYVAELNPEKTGVIYKSFQDSTYGSLFQICSGMRKAAGGVMPESVINTMLSSLLDTPLKKPEETAITIAAKNTSEKEKHKVQQVKEVKEKKEDIQKLKDEKKLERRQVPVSKDETVAEYLPLYVADPAKKPSVFCEPVTIRQSEVFDFSGLSDLIQMKETYLDCKNSP